MKKLLLLLVLATVAFACQQSKKGYSLPDPHDAILYEVNPQMLTFDGSTDALAHRLDSIRALHVNVLWLNPAYGTPDHYKSLVSQCHEKGMSVIINWAADDSSHDPSKQRTMVDNMKHWVSEVGIDGFYCQSADSVPFDHWKQTLDTLRSLPKRLLMLADGQRVDHFEAGFDINPAAEYLQTTRRVFRQDSSALQLLQTDYLEYDTIPQGKVKLRYITNHSEAAFHSPVQDFGGVRGSMAAYVSTIFLRGGAMLYDGQELIAPELYDEYKTLLGLYNKYGALKWGQLVAYPAVDALVFEKRYEKQDFLLLVNVRNREVEAFVPKEWQGQRVTDMMRDARKELPSSTLSLQPYEYFILKK